MNDDIPEDFHPYVRLLITRLRSHPEEFNPFIVLSTPKPDDFMTEAERQFLWNEERKIALDLKHQELMRRIVAAGEPKEDFTTEQLEKAMKQAQGMQQQQSMAASQAYQSSLQNNHNSLLGAQAQGPYYPGNYNSMMNSQPIYPGTTNAQTIALGYPTTSTTTTIDTNVLEKMKRALGL